MIMRKKLKKVQFILIYLKKMRTNFQKSEFVHKIFINKYDDENKLRRTHYVLIY